jgi:hypothetical protein
MTNTSAIISKQWRRQSRLGQRRLSKGRIALHREIGSFAFVVLTDAGVDVVGTADGQASGISKLNHHKAGFTVLPAPTRGGTLEPQEAVLRVLEGVDILIGV